jgi:hypothetical protein
LLAGSNVRIVPADSPVTECGGTRLPDVREVADAPMRSALPEPPKT